MFALACPVIQWRWAKKRCLALFIAPKCVKSQNQLPFHTMKHWRWAECKKKQKAGDTDRAKHKALG